MRRAMMPQPLADIDEIVISNRKCELRRETIARQNQAYSKPANTRPKPGKGRLIPLRPAASMNSEEEWAGLARIRAINVDFPCFSLVGESFDNQRLLHVRFAHRLNAEFQSGDK